MERNMCKAYGIIHISLRSQKRIHRINSLQYFMGGMYSSHRNASFYGKNFKRTPVPDFHQPLEEKESKFGKYLLLAIPIATFSLGVWQVYRWRRKLGLIEQLETKVKSEPIEFPFDNIDQLKNLEYRKVIVRGNFLNKHELIMGPRSFIQPNDQDSSATKGLGIKPKSGYHVVTPFTITNDKSSPITILVNRGWIPNKNYRLYPPTKEEVEIIGVVRKTEKRAPFMAKNVPGEHGMWFSRDIPEMAKYVGANCSEAFLDLASNIPSPDPTIKNPIPFQTRVSLANDHVSYFFTWFSLSAITAGMWHRLFILKKPLK